MTFLLGKIPGVNQIFIETNVEKTVTTEKFDDLWHRIEKVLSTIFNSLWLLPLFVVSKIVCSFWFNEVAENCYFVTYKKVVQPQSISVFIADLLFSIIVQLVFLIQCAIINCFPIFGVNYLLNLVHCSLLHAWYAFEFKWINFGWDVTSRLDQLHTFWPYYVGFGLPMHLIMNELVDYLSDYKKGILSGCLFSAFFPILIVSAISSSRELKVESSSTIKLRLFQPSVVFTDWALKNMKKVRMRVICSRIPMWLVIRLVSIQEWQLVFQK